MWALSLAFALFLFGCAEEKPQAPVEKYAYESVPNDPIGGRIYTLKNGLKVYLSVNKDEPRIQTFVAVRAGSKSDPKETTGLAHYLEHMMFKGTHKIGTSNWEEESVLLDQISDLYEKHRMTDDEEEKKAIYHMIDSISYEASKLTIPNEYDKMMSSIGASGTNAYTWVEQTVYVNNIPANELEKWMMLDSERFKTLVLRLFHTELEAVYEEFNRAYDRDGRKSWKAFNEGLFPTHPYGTQTTIGEGEHLKNPSMVNIHNYYNKYYIPNNIAICLSGDLDPDATMDLVTKYFGDWEAKPLDPWVAPELEPITEPIVKEAVGVQPEHFYLGYRLDGAGSEDALMAELLSGVLSNGMAGLIDLDLVQKQRVLSMSAFPVVMADYTIQGFYGAPKEGQPLEELKDLALAQLDSIKQGKFDDWLIDAVVKNAKLDEIRALESNRARADKFVDAFILGLDYEDVVHKYDNMAKITKQQLIDWTTKKLTDKNYVVVYKRNGKDKEMPKVDKPAITPIVINRDSSSEFTKEFMAKESGKLTPVFADYDKDIARNTINDQVPFSYVLNKDNELFSLYYVLDMGTDNDKLMGMAVNYLPFLGTDKYTAAELRKEFFKLGVDINVSAGRDKVYVSLSGLTESFEEGLALFEEVLANVEPDEQALNDMVANILKDRSDAKKDKNSIMRGGMLNYGKYGPVSPQTDILSEADLKAVKPEQLTDKLKQLTSYKHEVFYYGPMSEADALALISTKHQFPSQLNAYPEATVYTELSMDKNTVYFVDYDMVQAEIMMLSKADTYDPDIATYTYLFNEYFGAGLSSIVFQELRESKALAYSAYSYISTPRKKDESHYVLAYIGTQANKLNDATDAMLQLMSNMPEAADQFNNARDAAMKKIESDRTLGASVYWAAESAKRRGLDHDINKDIYQKLPSLQVTDLKKFFDEKVKDRNYTFLVLGKKEDLDMDALNKLGTVKELTLEEIFNY